MADFFLDISAVGNEYQAYSDTPTTWAVPQDGNGRAGPGHTAAVAIATIDVAGCTASGTGTIGVLGVTVSSTLNASGAALATAIAAAINASGTATAASVCQALLPLNRLVFARVNPGVSTQVQIMMRIAGVDWNGLAPTQANISPAATIGAFAGGANGPLAYWMAATTVFGRALASAPAYGIANNKPPGVTDITTADTVFVRCARGGSSLTAPTYSYSTSRIAFTFTARTYVIDSTGETWTGDAGSFSFGTFSNSSAGSSEVFFGTPFRLLARSKGGLKWTHDGGQNAATVNWGPQNTANAVMELHNVTLEEGAAGVFSWLPQNSHYKLMNGVRMRLRAGRTLESTNGNQTSWVSRWYDCDFEYYAAAPTPSGLVALGTINSSSDTLVEFVNCRAAFAANGPITQPITGTGGNSATRIVFDNCVGFRPETMPAVAGDTAGLRTLVFTGCADQGSGTVARSAMIDTGHAQVSWIDNNTLPYLDASTPTGSLWSLKALIKSGRSNWVAVPLASISGLYRTADAAKVLTVELLVPTGVVFNRSQLGVMFTFTDSTGQINHVTTLQGYDKVVTGGTAALAASAAVWTRASGLDTRKVEFDTASISKLLKSGTEVTAKVVYIGNTPGGLDRTIYINPEIKFA